MVFGADEVNSVFIEQGLHACVALFGVRLVVAVGVNGAWRIVGDQFLPNRFWFTVLHHQTATGLFIDRFYVPEFSVYEGYTRIIRREFIEDVRIKDEHREHLTTALKRFVQSGIIMNAQVAPVPKECSFRSRSHGRYA
jgi:hypothetical protein